MIVPANFLSADALSGLIEEFVTRDGTDYGEQELTLEQKVHLLMPQVMRGDVLIIFDEDSESVTLIPKTDL